MLPSGLTEIKNGDRCHASVGKYQQKSSTVIFLLPKVNFHKKKWLINCSYNPQNNNFRHLEVVNKNLML